MVGGVVEIGDCEARFLQLLFHSRDGALAATFQTRVVHATGRDERPFPWAAQTRRLAEGLRIDPPAEAAPRGLPAALDAGLAGLAAADRMGLVPIAAGAFKAAEADVFGRVRPDAFMGRISDGMPAFDAALQADDDSPLRPPGIGAATLEFRLGYQAWPRPGDRFVIRTGLAAIEARTRRMAHWILDPRSGGVWAVAQAVDVDLDLTARKSAPFAPDELARLRARVTPGLSG
jgi:acyl-CoA thioester hydrolase